MDVRRLVDSGDGMATRAIEIMTKLGAGMSDQALRGAGK
jgi:hypothetical protein